MIQVINQLILYSTAYVMCQECSQDSVFFFWGGGMKFPYIEGTPSNFVVKLTMLKIETFN